MLQVICHSGFVPEQRRTRMGEGAWGLRLALDPSLGLTCALTPSSTEAVLDFQRLRQPQKPTLGIVLMKVERIQDNYTSHLKACS